MYLDNINQTSNNIINIVTLLIQSDKLIDNKIHTLYIPILELMQTISKLNIDDTYQSIRQEPVLLD
jgi:hypothetical protein